MNEEVEKRPLPEIMEDFSKAAYGKECRKIHRELRKFYGRGLPLFMRYPNFPLHISVFAVVFGIIAILM